MEAELSARLERAIIRLDARPWSRAETIVALLEAMVEASDAFDEDLATVSPNPGVWDVSHLETFARHLHDGDLWDAESAQAGRPFFLAPRFLEYLRELTERAETDPAAATLLAWFLPHPPEKRPGRPPVPFSEARARRRLISAREDARRILDGNALPPDRPADVAIREALRSATRRTDVDRSTLVLALTAAIVARDPGPLRDPNVWSETDDAQAIRLALGRAEET